MAETTSINSDVQLLNSTFSPDSGEFVPPGKTVEKVKDSKVKDDVKDLDDDVKLLDEEVETDIDEEVESDDEPDEPDEDEEELEESTEDSYHNRPTLTDIKKKYPDFFKTFPDLKHMMFREQQYTTLYPTLDSAKEAYDNNQTFESLRNDLFDGDGKAFVQALKDSDGLENFSTKFLDNLSNADKDTHWKVVAPILQNVVRSAYSRGIRSGDESLANSAAWIADYLFGGGGTGQNIDPQVIDLLKGKISAVPENKKPEEKKIDPELNRIKIERFNEYSGDINGQVEKGIRDQIQKGLEGRELSKLEVKTLTNDIVDEVVNSIIADKNHMAKIDTLWKSAIKNGFKHQDKSSIISASLARASSLIPSIRRKLLSEALKDSKGEGLRAREITDRVNSRREVGNQGRPSKNNVGRVVSAKHVNWSKTSDMDFLNGKVTTR